MMRERYMLATGMLTGLTIPASTLPDLLATIPESVQVQKNLSDAEYLELGRKIVSGIEAPQPEPSIEDGVPVFSPEVNEGTSNRFKIPSEPNFSKPSNQPPSIRPVSGIQLYYQRLAALKNGHIYTRVDDNNLQLALLGGNKRKLTYEDWKGLLALEAKAIASGQGVNRLSILVGDSLSMWFPAEKLPSSKLWLNQGISGDTSGGVLRRISAFSQTRPEVIYVMAGINDLRKGLSDQAILRNHRRIVRSLRIAHPQAQIIVQSILPTRITTIKNERIRRLNEQIAAIAKQEGANYLNIHSWFVDSQGNMRTDLSTDGLHLSQRGYDVWRHAIQQVEFKVAVARIERAVSKQNNQQLPQPQ